MKIQGFEDIKAWQEARILVNMVYNAVKSDKGFGNEWLHTISPEQRQTLSELKELK